MDYPPNDDNQSQYTPPQPNTSYPPQQPGASYPLPQPPYPYQPPPPVPPKKGTSPALWVAIGVIVVLFLCIFSSSLHTGSQNASTGTATTTQDTSQPTDTVQPTDTPVPTDTPIPTVSPAQLEKAFKALTKPTTVDSLDKNGSSWKGKDVHFTCTILDFVKDSSGNTAGANVDDPNTSGVVQVVFPNNTDLSRLNTGDTLEVWGTDDGTFSGQNAYGGTVQEVGITAQYMTDKTTNYQTS